MSGIGCEGRVLSTTGRDTEFAGCARIPSAPGAHCGWWRAFVSPGQDGTSFKAANFVCVGHTAGRGHGLVQPQCSRGGCPTPRTATSVSRPWRTPSHTMGARRSSTPTRVAQFTSAAFPDVLNWPPAYCLPGQTQQTARGDGWTMFVERLWRSVKYEEVYLHACESVAAARAGLGRYFRFYNAERRHQGWAPDTRCGVCWQRFGPRQREAGEPQGRRTASACPIQSSGSTSSVADPTPTVLGVLMLAPRPMDAVPGAPIIDSARFDGPIAEAVRDERHRVEDARVEDAQSPGRAFPRHPPYRPDLRRSRESVDERPRPVAWEPNAEGLTPKH